MGCKFSLVVSECRWDGEFDIPSDCIEFAFGNWMPGLSGLSFNQMMVIDRCRAE